MIRFILRRILVMVPTFIVVSLLTFIIIQLPPGDYVTTTMANLAATGEAANVEKVELLRKQYGLDLPLPLQYLRWLKGMFVPRECLPRDRGSRGRLGPGRVRSRSVPRPAHRRVLPAVALTLAAWTGFAFLASGLRDHYATPLLTSAVQLDDSAVTVDQWWTKGNARVTYAEVDQVLQAAGVQPIDGGTITAAPGNQAVHPVQYLIEHGYLKMTTFQPDSRYWPFQWIELGWLTILSLLLLGTSVWLLRRRSA